MELGQTVKYLLLQCSKTILSLWQGKGENTLLELVFFPVHNKTILKYSDSDKQFFHLFYISLDYEK